MTEFFKNNPIGLRHLLLYQFLQKKSIEYDYFEFREAVGHDVIKTEELQRCFDQFEKGKFGDNEEPVTDMRDVLRNDKYALRVCILYESIKLKNRKNRNYEFIHHPAFSVYMRFCKAIGEDVMDYQEFDFWLHRFANGVFDLKFEREKEEKILELMDMPIDIMRNIVEYLDIGDRSSLEKTSISLRLFSQDQKVFHDDLTFEATWYDAYISFGRGGRISYRNTPNYCEMEFKRRKKVMYDVNVHKKAFQDFKKILENPKLYLHTLIISLPSWLEDSDSIEEHIEDALKLTHLLHVKHITFRTRSMKALLNILPSLKPGYLTTITSDAINTNADEAAIKELVEMDQWKQAKYLYMRAYLFVGPLRHLYHFKEFHVVYRKLLVNDVREINEILLKSPDFEGCTLHSQGSEDSIAIMQVFDGSIKEISYICHCPIPNSTEYFEIRFMYCILNIKREKK